MSLFPFSVLFYAAVLEARTGSIKKWIWLSIIFKLPSPMHLSCYRMIQKEGDLTTSLLLRLTAYFSCERGPFGKLLLLVCEVWGTSSVFEVQADVCDEKSALRKYFRVT